MASLPMNRESWVRLFGHRSHFLGMKVAPADRQSGSRIGGRPPQACLPLDRCPRCGGPLSYYLTLDLADPFGSGKQISIFLCRDFACLLSSSASTLIPEKSSLRIVVHPPSPRAGLPTEADSHLEPRGLQLMEEASEPSAPAWPHDGSKVGGRPSLLQKEGIDLELEKTGLQFIAQWNELDFPRGMRIGTYPLAGGTLYLFGRLADASLDTTHLFGFWQRT